VIARLSEAPGAVGSVKQGATLQGGVPDLLKSDPLSVCEGVNAKR
jgi:hypothetical protein